MVLGGGEVGAEEFYAFRISRLIFRKDFEYEKF